MTRTAATTARCVLERGPATNPLFTAFFEAAPAGRLHAHRRRQRLPPGGLRAVRPQHPPRAAVGARAAPTCIRCWRRPNLERPDARAGHAGRCSRARAPSASSIARQGGGASGARAARSSSPAARSTRRRCSSSRASGSAGELGALGIDVVADLPGVGENLQDHLEVYIQYSCKQPVSMQPPATLWRRPIGCAVAVPPPRAGRDEPLRGRRLRALERRRRATRT